MVDTVKDYVVGLGYEYDKVGEGQALKGLTLIRSRALALGGALIGAGASVNLVARRFAEHQDALGKTGRTIGESAENINALGQAIQHEGGSLDDAVSSLASLDDLIARFSAGDAGAIGEAGRFDIDVTPILEAQTAMEALLLTAEAFEEKPRRARVAVGGILGLDDATVRLLSRGRDAVEGILAAEAAIRPIPQEYIDNAAAYNDEMQTLGNNLGRVADQFGNAFSKGIADRIRGVNEALAENADVVERGIQRFIELPAAVENAQVALAQRIADFIVGPSRPEIRPLAPLPSGAPLRPLPPSRADPSDSASIQDIIAPGFELPSADTAPPSDSVSIQDIIAPGFELPSADTAPPSAAEARPATVVAPSGPSTAIINVELGGDTVRRYVVDLIDREAQSATDDILATGEE